MRQNPSAYSGAQKLLHWVNALLVLTLLPMGFIMVNRGEATNFDAVTGQLYAAHKSFGFLLLLLLLVRIALRLGRGVTAPATGLSRPQALAATAVHGSLYLLLLAVPLLGWTGVSAYGALDLLGGASLPEILAKNPERAKTLLSWHSSAAILLAALVFIHIAAALAHRFLFRDGVMQRMLP